MSRAHLENIERVIQKKLQQENLKKVRWFRGRNKMFLFVNGKTSVMLLRFRMHTHHNLLPLLIALEKKNKSPTLWETATSQCLELIAVTRCCPTTQGQEKYWGATKKQGYTSLKSILPMHSSFTEIFIPLGPFSQISWKHQEKVDGR